MNEDITYLTEEQREELHDFYLNIDQKHLDKYDIVRFFFDFYLIIGEIDNGGIHQFLINNTGDCFNRVNTQLLKYEFKLIHNQFNLIKKILSVDLIPDNRDERFELLDRFGDDQYELFEEIDRYFQKNSLEIEAKLFSFYRNYNEELNVIYL